ncbi:MAG: class I SAM-dependent methyltransferase [Chloroflexaceae bacterium]|jgi:23S rRNA (cytosine1962-C5)-methyltransferase|nr:class I SAM-dependent methyltransferase [Chloroflexaceae bacterium]
MASIILRPGRERPLQQRHPWVFSGAIASVRGNPADGDVVEIQASSGEWLARGTWSGASQIRARVFTWNADERLDEPALRRKLQRAIAGRPAEASACRLVYAESDGLPGLIVDRYGPVLVMQLLTVGMAVRVELITKLLAELVQPAAIYERSDADVREKEGLPPAEGLRWGELPAERLTITPYHWHAADRPSKLRFEVDMGGGQKTGFYLDQAMNRQRVAAYCQGAEVLDCFCYTGGFSAYAAEAGASHITALDTSGPALEQAQSHMALNGLTTPFEALNADVFKQLRLYRGEGRQFDLIILDPPKFVHNQGQLDRATRGYKDINLLAMQLLRPGGVLATFSCSGLVSADLFQKVVFGAAVDARRDVQVIERLTQSPDHPLLLSFPEGEYLKGFICRVW